MLSMKLHALHGAALADTLRCSISLNDLCSELAAQKEKGHLTHSIFNFDNPIDIHLSNPGDNAEELDPTTKNVNKQSISKANSLQRSSGSSLDITGCMYNMFLMCHHCH